MNKNRFKSNESKIPEDIFEISAGEKEIVRPNLDKWQLLSVPMDLNELKTQSGLSNKKWDKTIKGLTKNWDFERIANMDILIMVMAIAEAMEFSSIPTKVTLTEYIEIAKYYSTEKSSIFINGILDKTFQILIYCVSLFQIH